jgi:hypothetical protein
MPGPLNPSPNANNLLGAVLKRYPPVGPTADTGEATGTALTATGNVTVTFPLNGAGQQPQVSHGYFGILVYAVNAATTVGPITVTATDGTIIEVVDAIPAWPAGRGGCLIRPFTPSNFAGTDAFIGNIKSLTAAVTLAGTTTAATVIFVATGSP